MKSMNKKNNRKKISIPPPKFLNQKPFPLLLLCITAVFMVLSISSPFVYADGFPPYWDNSTGAVHWAPVNWPTTWIPYTSQSLPIKDARTADPSNGGTSPQNYANISSSCTDQSQPSVAWAYNSSPFPVFFFRWKVEQIANSYATGPLPGTYSNVDPWKCAQWTVLMDINGDGFYDFAVNIDGCSGLPATPIDLIKSIYNTTKSQSVDVTDPGVHLLFHNPTAFIENSTSRILNFRNSNNPTIDWPNGAAETVWDYGTTRSTDITTYSPTKCIEYNIDYQIPLGMLDATAHGGPKMDPNTPFCMTFVTANSNINPLQKDVGFDTSFLGDVDKCVPCGDLITANGGASIPQPTVDWVTAEGCGPTTLTAQVRDALTCGAFVQHTLFSVRFYYYYDKNGNGLADDAGSNWTPIDPLATVGSTPNIWSVSWDSTGRKNGQYLIGVRAQDNDGNITWSYLTQAQAGSPPNYANITPSPGVVYGKFVNTCGKYVSIVKTPSTSYVPKGDTVDFTITINNATSSSLTVNSISDILPSNFTYVSTTGGTLTPTCSTLGGTGTITWTCTPAVTIAAGGTGTLTFRTDTDNVVLGTYTNVSTANTNEEGVIISNPVDISVGAPRLTISKSASVQFANPGDTITYTITYSNDSPVNTTGVTITDPLPVGLTFVSASNGGVYNSGIRTITWTLPDLASGEGPYTVSFNATVNTSATAQPQNSACIDSVETDPACAGAIVNISTPLKLQKSVNPILVSPGNTVTFTMNYANTGTSTLTNAQMTDTIPTGFAWVSSAAEPTCPAGTHSGGNPDVVTWTLGSLSSGATGTCTFVARASNPYTGSNPAINMATITADNTIPVSDSTQVGVTQSACSSPVTYHMHAQTMNVGFDGTQKIANATAPTSLTDTIIESPQGTGSPVEFARFYQDPPLSSGGTLNSPVTVIYWAEKVQGAPTVYAYLYDYNPNTGTSTLLGSGAGAPVGTLKQDTITVTLSSSNTVYEGHRLLWVFSVQGNGSIIRFYYDNTTHDAYSPICLSPAYLVMNKSVDTITANQGGTLQYTIKFGNTSPSNVSGAQIIDTLPAGVTYNSATLNGVAATPASIVGQVYTFNVNTSDTAIVGRLTAGQTGTLVINVTIQSPIVFDHNPLINVADLVSNQTTSIRNTATTNVTGVPILGIKKRASATLLKPGDLVTFYLDIVNIGNAAISSYTVTDYITGRAYLSFGSISDSGTLTDLTGGTCDPGDSCKITWNLGSLTANTTKTVSYTMQVSSTINPPDSNGVPEGFTTETDYGRVSYGVGPTTSDSNNITVSLYTNANLRITKSVSSPAPYTESVGTGNGTNKIFNKTLAHTPVQSGKLTVLVNGIQVGADSGTGVIIGNNLQNSTINYSTGALSLTFITAPALNDLITASYNVPANPGDTFTYTITVTNIGASNATDVLVTDPIPANTSYKANNLVYDSLSKTDANDSSDNAYFDAGNNRVVFVINNGSSLNYQDLLPNQSHAIQYSVTIDSPLTSGTTTTTNTATASSSNTASKDATATFAVKAAPVLSLTKSAPSLIPYPLTYVNGNHTSQTVINVFSTLYIAAGDVIFLSGQAVTVTAVNPATNQITVSRPVSPGNKNPVYPTIRYRFTYKNTGNADATNVVITDVLSSSPQLNYIQATPTPTSAPPVDSNGTVTWNLGTVPAGATGTITLWARPTGAGTYLNNGTMSSSELPSFSSNTTSTIVGGIKVAKSTSTPTVINNPADGIDYATYAITLTNDSSTAVPLIGGVSVTDTLPDGFTYNNTISITGGACQFSPTVGSTTPTWSNCSVPAFGGGNPGVTTITFRARLAATVGAGTYQNPITATYSSPVIPFDEIATSAEDVTVTVPNDLRVTKAVQSLSSPCTAPTCQVTYLVTVTNVGTAQEGSIVINDTLPAQLTYVSSSTTNGSYISGTGNWTLASPLAANSSATLTITATVNTFPSQIRNCAVLTASSPLDTNSANNTGCTDIVPTLVTLSDFRAYEDNDKVVVEWATASEYDTAGFYLYRLDESKGDYIRLNHRLLPALLTSPQGGTYSLIDKGASINAGSITYILVEIEGKGSKNVYGPFTVQVGGESVTGTLNSDIGNLQLPGKCTTCSDRQKKVSSSEITQYFDNNGILVVTNRKDSHKEQAQTDTGADLFENYSRKAPGISDEKKARIQASKEQRRGSGPVQNTTAGDTAKISVTKQGLYYLDASKTSTFFGVSISDAKTMIKQNSLTVSNHGQKVAYLPAEGNSGIYFFGEGIDSNYTNENIYWLGKGKGQQMMYIGGHGPTLLGNGTFSDKIHAEEDLSLAAELFTNLDSDFWAWDYVIGGYAPYDVKNFPIKTKGVAAGSSNAVLTVNLQGFTSTQHHVIISLNGQQIGEGQWVGNISRTLVFNFPQTLLSEGVNTVQVNAVLDNGVPYSIFYVDSFDLTYQRLYRADADSLLFKGNGNQIVTVQGFTNPQIMVFDVTNPRNPAFNTATTIGGTAGNYHVSLVPAMPDATYLAISPNAAITNMNAAADTPSNLSSRDNRADYIVIAPKELANAAQNLANYRQSKGFVSKVVLLEDIMDEFNYGISSPEAIHAFLSYAYQNWSMPPKYVVLAGDGSYDYKNNLGFGENLIPLMLSVTPFGIFPSDNLFADTDGDHVPEMAVGRLPVSTSQELQNILNKIISYESTPNSRIILLSDNADDGGNFPADSDYIASFIPPQNQVVKVYLYDPSNIDTVRQTLLNEMNNGAFLMNYFGHAGYDLLAYEALLSISNLGSLNNLNGLPVITAMTCLVGMYGLPGHDTLTEALVLKSNGGAVAVLSPTGLSYNFLARVLDEEFFKAAFESSGTILGDVILNALQEYSNREGSLYMLDIYNLLGDPALRLR